MFWIYWSLIGIGLLVLTTLALKNTFNIGDYVGGVIGQLLSNNNWRWGALFVLAVIFSLSAILAGFGRPLLITSAKEAKTNLVERVGSNNVVTITSQLNRLWRGTNSAPSVSTVVTKATEKKYSSWWHWLWAIFLWLAWLVYTPFAFADEAGRALKAAIKAVERKRRQIRNNPAVITPGATPSTAGVTGILAKGGFLWHLFIDTLGEYTPRFVNMVMKKLFR